MTMVGATKPSELAVSAKKQQSISQFFTKGSNASRTPTTLNPTTSQRNDPKTTCGNAQNEKDDSLFIASDSEEGHSSTPHTHQTTPKRCFTEVETEADLPPGKRRRGLDPHLKSPLSSNVNPASQAKKLKVIEKTSKYIYSSPRSEDVENAEDDQETARRKERLHQKFVNKLGRPDSIAEIKRRNRQLAEDSTESHPDAENSDDPDEDEAPKPVARGKKGSTAKKGGSKLTPMEKQFLEIKRKHLDTILIVEVGYKFRFFGEDARIAARELSIVCIPGKMRYDEHVCEAHLDRFASASVPVHRLHVHVKRLVNAGHKVGIVRQLETAALKAAGDNRHAPFVRQLTNLYTKGTYIDDVEGLEGPTGTPLGGAPATGYLVCITETNAKGWGTDEKVHVGILAVQPATGDVVHDSFEDGFMRSEIETRLLHIAPCEILIVGDLSKATERLIRHISGSSTNVFGDKVRVERVEKPKNMAAQAYNHEDERASQLLDKVLKLPEDVTMCLSAMIKQMSDFGLEHVFDLTKYFQSFSARSHMLLNGTTLTSLEIYQNQTDHSEKGSLFWTLDRTKTRFGHRLLRKWVGRPLLIKRDLEDRIAAVEELLSAERTVMVDKVKGLLSQIKSDLEKSLIRIYYGKCTRPELLTVLQTMQRIANEFATVKTPDDVGFCSIILNQAIASLPMIGDYVVAYLDKINGEAAKQDDKYGFFREEVESDSITDHKLGIASVERELDAHRADAASKLKKKRVDFVTSAGIEYLIEVDNTLTKHVPASWAKISGTKKLSRYHTPEVVRLIRERDQHREALAAACDVAFSELLSEISTNYQSFRDCIQALATLDCLLSLSAVAGQPGYIKPEYTEDTRIWVEQGRHPMVEQLLLDSYVPNDIDLAFDATRALLITGPNMGGKSSYVRQVALIAIMGQIGSYVPAASAKLGMLDAVFTRMGAFDNMMAGESTFMVELSETSDILKQASPRSLIILDELGRGTSTHDGVAIAQAVLDHVVRETKSLTLFITHYQHLSALAHGSGHGQLKNVHMKFYESGENGQDITFLYEVGEGVAHRSYGLNVARLANIPESVLDIAALKSKELEDKAAYKNISHLSRTMQSIINNDNTDQLDQLVADLEQL